MNDLFTYPAAPGAQARSTSDDAAHAIKGRAATLRAQALRLLQTKGPMTADECAAALGASVLAMRPRLTELGAMGKIKDSGLRRANESGRMAIVWHAP